MKRDGYDDDYYNDIDRWFSGACKYLDMYGFIFMFPVWDENGSIRSSEVNNL